MSVFPLKDNKIYRWIMIPICLALCFFGRFIPIPNLSTDAVGVIFIFLGVLIMWLTIGIGWPSLLCLLALGFLPAFGFSKVFTSSFGNSTWVFLLFTFICTFAISQTPLIKRIAIGFVNNKLAKKNGFLFISLFLVGTLVLGLFISPTVLFVVLLPILEEIFKISKVEKGEKIGKVLMMGLGFTVSISSGMTTIAHVFPVLAMEAAHVSVSPLQYMGFAIPVGLIIFILMLVMFFIYLRKEDLSKLKNVDVTSLKEELPKMGKAEIITLVIFAIVILLWIVPSFFKDAAPDFYKAINQYGTAMPPLLGALALCIIRVDKKPLVNIEDAFKKGIPWQSLLMCAATLALGAAMTSDAIGLNTFLQNNIGEALKSCPAIVILIVFGLWAGIQTNLSSNMVTATLVATVAASVIGPMIGLSLPVVACIIGMLASFAFATPPSMPHIAIIAGSDYCDTKHVLIFGLILMFVSIAIALAVGYPLGTLII